jgi:tetratricopeptide (TPR) repeat protein
VRSARRLRGFPYEGVAWGSDRCSCLQSPASGYYYGPVSVRGAPLSSVGSDEAAVQLGLRAALERLDAAPYAFLGLVGDPTPAQARSAYLALTKKYHPTKFARFSPDTVRLANEVFLALKRVYEALERGAGARPARAGSQPMGGAPRPASPAAAAAARTAPPRRAAVHMRPTEPPATQPAAVAAAAARAQTAAPSVSTRVPVVSVRMHAAGAPAEPASASAGGPVSAPGGTTTRIPQTSPFVRIDGGASRPTTPSTSQAIPRADAPSVRRNTPLRGVPQTGRTPRLDRPADGTGSEAARNPVPASSATRIPRLATGTDEEAAFAQGLDLLRRRLWNDAEKVFAQLAITVPSEKRYRAHRHYARGRIAQDLGRHDDARSEWERAVGLEPSLNVAKAALEQLPEPEPTKPQGLFGKIFRR